MSVDPTNMDMENESSQYTAATGNRSPDNFGYSYEKAKAVLATTGLTNKPTPQDVHVGFNSAGDKVFSNPQLSNNTSTEVGKQWISTSGMSLGAMGAFKDHNETTAFLGIGEKAADPQFHNSLDTLKNAGDVQGFLKQMDKSSGPIPSNDKTGYAAYKLYDNWNSMSPSQKSIGIAGVGIQGFKFDDGKSFDTKNITPDINGVPPLHASTGLALAGQGINVAPAARNWDQHSVIQETLYHPKNSTDIVNTSNSLGLLGSGMEGAAAQIDSATMKNYNVTPAPHYGVGAATIPVGQGAPTGYVPVGQVKGSTVVVPKANVGNVSINTPEVSTTNATNVYKTWDKANTPPTKGTVGGSALIGGLTSMAQSNPYSLGAVMTHATYQHTGVPSDTTDMAHIGNLASTTLNRLKSGGASKDIDSQQNSLPVGGDFSEENFANNVKQIRGDYSKAGISSKEVGYQLANQAYAEGRLNESQHVAAQKTLDTVFDDNGFTLASKILTGKDKGIQILQRRQ